MTISFQSTALAQVWASAYAAELIRRPVEVYHSERSGKFSEVHQAAEDSANEAARRFMAAFQLTITNP